MNDVRATAYAIMCDRLADAKRELIAADRVAHRFATAAWARKLTTIIGKLESLQAEMSA